MIVHTLFPSHSGIITFYFHVFVLLNHTHIAWAEIPGGRGGGDASPPPPTILKVGGHKYIKCPPPPHVFVVGRFFVEKIGFLTKFVNFFFFFFFFFFLLVRMSESDRRVYP